MIIGVRAPSDLGGRWVGRGGELLARKNYAMPESVNVEIAMLAHSNCVKNKNVHKDSYIESLHTQ